MRAPTTSKTLFTRSGPGSLRRKPNAWARRNSDQVGPIPRGSRPQSGSTKKRGDGRGGDADPELEQFASDPHVPPPRVLPPESDHQVPDLAVDRRSPRLAARAGRRPAPELPVRPEERLGAHQEAGPPLPREQAGGRPQPGAPGRPFGIGAASPAWRSRRSGGEGPQSRGPVRRRRLRLERAGPSAEEPVDPRPEHRGILAPETHLNNDAGHGTDRVSLPHNRAGEPGKHLDDGIPLYQGGSTGLGRAGRSLTVDRLGIARFGLEGADRSGDRQRAEER
jgi:hypothetical protein